MFYWYFLSLLGFLPLKKSTALSRPKIATEKGILFFAKRSRNVYENTGVELDCGKKRSRNVVENKGNGVGKPECYRKHRDLGSVLGRNVSVGAWKAGMLYITKPVSLELRAILRTKIARSRNVTENKAHSVTKPECV